MKIIQLEKNDILWITVPNGVSEQLKEKISEEVLKLGLNRFIICPEDQLSLIRLPDEELPPPKLPGNNDEQSSSETRMEIQQSRCV